ncbi:hypothetical protein [uncultured Aliiroseovarius sp.]|uniref:hypothetical protein n=1 Tax=uncultured Aliiroseovarius sp. TaxID=1658783 RepID=UPI00261C7D84|nr:hypothetical protein [uncultured Aliiroseovarius sp.]
MFDTYIQITCVDALQPNHCNSLQFVDSNRRENIPASPCETKDNYVGEIVRRGRFRVISGKNKLHWIIQKQRTSAKSKQGITWSGVSYPWDRNALIAAWKAKTKLTVPDEIMAMPVRFSLTAKT